MKSTKKILRKIEKLYKKLKKIEETMVARNNDISEKRRKKIKKTINKFIKKLSDV